MHFDWSTLALQTINVLVLLWLLQRFLFRPVVEIIARRKGAADKLLADATAANAQAQEAVAEATRHEKELAAGSDQILAGVRTEAEAERVRLLTQAKGEAEQVRKDVLVSVEQERKEMRHELEVEARRLAVSIASRLLGRIPAEAISAALLQSLTQWFANLTPEEIGALVEPGEPLDVITAVSLDATAQAGCAAVLARRLGFHPALHFVTDPTLLAGIELRGAHARLQNSWRADLDQIVQELNRDDEPVILA